MNDGQGFQTEKVEFDQPRRFDPFHVELGGGHVRAGVLVEGDQFVQGPVADHHTGGMGGGVAVKPFDFLGIGQKAAHHLFLGGFAQAGFVRQGFGDGDGFHPLDRDHLREPVHLPVGHLQHAPHIAHGGLGQKRAKGDDLGHLVAAVFLLHVLDHLFPAIHAKVDVEVGHRDAFGVEEAFEQQGIAQRVKVGDGQRIGDE